jgi:hypothetical protein
VNGHRNSFIGPLVLIGIGLMFLVNNIVVDLPVGEILRRGWPFLLILIGVVQLVAVPLRAAQGRRADLVGPIVLITVGSLFALQSVWRVSFRDTWPLIPIAIGVAMLAQNALSPLGWFRRFGGRP